jgi:hypothetical protein
MADENLLTRREFTIEWALAVLSAATITISCGDGNDPGTGPTNSGDRNGVVSANHGHVALVTATQLNSQNAIPVDIRGNATHPHLIELTVSQLQTISTGGRVSVVSSTDDFHDHTVTFN